MATSLEHMTASEIGEWLEEHGFSEDVVASFQGKDYVFGAAKLAKWTIELFHVTSHVQIMTWHKKGAILVHIENVWAKIGTS